MKLLLMIALLVLLCVAAVVLPHRQGRTTPTTSESDNPADPAHPRELGLVDWMRGYEAAAQRAHAEKKPIMILFQEVPGCATCVGYGQQVLRHPLIVEAVETEFVPLAVYNNIEGDDRRTLVRFNEPSWNNPVVRVVTAEGKDIIPRVDADYTQFGLVRALVEALQESGREIPGYLRSFYDELRMQHDGTERATFAMYCFWTGEAEFGRLNGVARTRAGYLDGHEVVEVRYDPGTITYGELVRHAESQKCATNIYTYSSEQLEAAREVVGDRAQSSPGPVRPDSEPKYYLAHHPLRFVPMTDLQQARVNAALGRGEDAFRFLSPRQRAYYSRVQEFPDRAWRSTIDAEDIADVWMSDRVDVSHSQDR